MSKRQSLRNLDEALEIPVDWLFFDGPGLATVRRCITEAIDAGVAPWVIEQRLQDNMFPLSKAEGLL